jgi:succinyl-diaminopimelate desuccinylase
MTADLPALSRERIAELCLAMTSIASPTGTERPLAEWLARHLLDLGIETELQPFAASRANVVARLRGVGDGPSILLYSPIDTAFPLDGQSDAEAPWSAPFQPVGSRQGDWIVGSGAENPKGYATCVLGAFEALCDTTVRPRGDVVLALTGGGMPTPGVAQRPDTDGLGRGCQEFFARNPVPADVALIAKPGDAVSVEEAGIALFRIDVHGDLAYTGSRHRAPVRDAVLDAARLVERLEAWFPTYTAAHRTRAVAPQAAITGVAAGWAAQPAFLPSVCELRVDLRVAPGMSLDDAEAELRSRVDQIGAELESDLVVARLGGFPGAATDRDSWIVRLAIATWERRAGRPHVETTDTSGVTDAAILRKQGIPTVRIGMPRPAAPSPYPGFSMGVVHVDAMASLARTIYEIAREAAWTRRSEVIPTEPAAEARA